jgi:transposase-like protein
MPRKSKLTEPEWAEVERRHLIVGESINSLAKEYGINKSNISKRIAQHVKKQKELAKQVAIVETAVAELPIAQQMAVRQLADHMKGMSKHLAAAGEYGAMVAHRMNGLASEVMDKIDLTKPEEVGGHLKNIGSLAATANAAANISLNLLAANKDGAILRNNPPPPETVVIPEDDNAASEAYQFMIRGGK